jgi:hypothetical protein
MSGIRMDRARYILLFITLAYLGCASAPPPSTQPANAPPAHPADEFSSTIGIASHPDDKPLVLDVLTHVIPLNADGTMPRMAVHVKRSPAKEFLISYIVYRRVQGSDAYELTEESPLWRIHPGAVSSDAMIRPDFRDGIFVGEYRFEIFVDQSPWRTVEFKIIPYGDTSPSAHHP